MDKDSLPNTLRSQVAPFLDEHGRNVALCAADEIEHLEGVIEKHEAQLRVINSLRWRICEAQNIGHQEEETKGDLTEYLDSIMPHQETHADRVAALAALKAIGRIP